MGIGDQMPPLQYADSGMWEPSVRTLVTLHAVGRKVIPRKVRTLVTLSRTLVTEKRVVHRTLVTHPNRTQITF